MAKMTPSDYRRASLLGWARRREQDDKVAFSIPEDLQVVWGLVKNEIKSVSPWNTPAAVDERYNAFMDYVHDHQSEIAGILQDAADEKLNAMLEARASQDSFSSECPF